MIFWPDWALRKPETLLPFCLSPCLRGEQTFLIGIESLFFERIPAHVVSVLLPESRLIAIKKLEAAHPLHRLPGIELRNDESKRIAMIWHEWLPIMVRCQQHVIAIEV